MQEFYSFSFVGIRLCVSGILDTRSSLSVFRRDKFKLQKW